MYPLREEFVARKWDDEDRPALIDYIRIPCKSPHFDPDWQATATSMPPSRWRERLVPRAAASGHEARSRAPPGRTPVLFFELPGKAPGTVLMYGHLDKQPEMAGWSEGSRAVDPGAGDGKLYGRGGADDGYAMFASLAAHPALQEQGVPHARCVVLIECCEESGSYDLPAYLEALEPRIGRWTWSSASIRAAATTSSCG